MCAGGGRPVSVELGKASRRSSIHIREYKRSDRSFFYPCRDVNDNVYIYNNTLLRSDDDDDGQVLVYVLFFFLLFYCL